LGSSSRESGACSPRYKARHRHHHGGSGCAAQFAMEWMTLESRKAALNTSYVTQSKKDTLLLTTNVAE
jgi:hypothetical protein